MRWQPPIIAILIGFLTTTTFNSLGWLQISERQLYDYYLKLRPQEPQDRKIVIVGLNEKDIEQFGFPISDNTLATLLTKIKAQNPRAIALDLHRNVNIGTKGNQELANIFNTTPQLIGVEKTDGGNPSLNSISPPTELAKRGQTGASEIIEDEANGIVRRGYLYVQKSSQNKTIPSLGLAVALKYLKKENIFPTSDGQQSWLKLGDAVFPMLQLNRLFYANSTIDNYQVLINYCNTKQKFSQVNISEVLENKVKPDFFQNKVVFIGTMAETIEDIYTTPYSYNSINYDFTYGVEIHASLTSQIINAAIAKRTIIKFLPTFWQYSGLLILLITITFSSWCLYSNKLIFYKQKTIVYIVSSIFNLVLILIIGYILLLWGWWIPTVTALLLAVSSEIGIYIFIKLERLQQENYILEEKVQERTQALEEAQKKILSQEKLALYQKLAQYTAHEIKNKTNIMGLNIQNSQTDLEELQLIIEDNAFLFEELTDSELRSDPGDMTRSPSEYVARSPSGYALRSPQEIISNLNNKLSRIESINQKVTFIIGQIYNHNVDKNNKDDSIDPKVDINQLLDTLLEDVLEISKTKYNNFEVIIERDYDEQLKKINCIASEIERAFDNIIANAIYYLYKKNTEIKNYQPKLSIFTQNKLNSIEIKIRDNGIGIASENLDKIFQIFWTTKTSPEGLGLGLHFGQELIEKHQGKISVTSIQGEYTEFIVTLPTQISND